MEGTCISVVVFIYVLSCYCLTALGKDTLHTVEIYRVSTQISDFKRMYGVVNISLIIQFWKIFSASPNSICPYFPFATPRQLVFRFQNPQICLFLKKFHVNRSYNMWSFCTLLLSLGIIYFEVRLYCSMYLQLIPFIHTHIHMYLQNSILFVYTIVLFIHSAVKDIWNISTFFSATINSGKSLCGH